MTLPFEVSKDMLDDYAPGSLEKVSPRELFSLWLGWEGIHGYTEAILSRAEAVIRADDASLSVDTLLGLSSNDQDALIPAMDRVQPDWVLKFADRRDLEEYLRATMRLDPGPELAAQLGSLQRRTLRRMADALWLLGHSALVAGGDK